MSFEMFFSKIGVFRLFNEKEKTAINMVAQFE